MRSLKAFVLGCAAATVLAYAALATFGVAAQASGTDLVLALAGLTFLEVRSGAHLDTLAVGPGIVLVGLIGGAANALAAAIFGRRAR